METKFTKGNWIFSKYEPTDFSVHSEEGSGNDIALVRGSKEETEANAKLIAAAPELLAALQKAVNYVAYPKDEKYYGWVTDAEQAIKKATE